MTAIAASMSQRAMPFIFLNMAGEMAYILEQRLIAQRVSQQRYRQVLSDIMGVVFNKKFLSKVFDPQEQYSRSSLRQYFEKMAHSSVMRLNEPSMDRLFDMMTMTVKQQILCVDEPRQIITVTINHLNGVRQIIKFDQEAVKNVNYAHDMLVSNYGETQTWEMALIRSALLNHFQDLRIRVSQMMRMRLQLQDGRFALTGDHVRLPHGAMPPGSIRYFDKGQLVRINTFVTKEAFHVPDYEGSLNPMDVSNRSTSLGDNIYRHEEDLSADPKRQDEMARTSTEVDEIKLLSRLINRPDPVPGADNFVLSMFGDESDSEKEEEEKKPKSVAAATAAAKENEVRVKVTVHKARSLADAVQAMDIKSEMSANKSSQQLTRGEQMLQMMDEAEAEEAAAAKMPKPRGSRSRSGSRKAVRNREPSAAAARRN